jgi:hypothetical protein
MARKVHAAIACESIFDRCLETAVSAARIRNPPICLLNNSTAQLLIFSLRRLLSFLTNDDARELHDLRRSVFSVLTEGRLESEFFADDFG